MRLRPALLALLSTCCATLAVAAPTASAAGGAEFFEAPAPGTVLADQLPNLSFGMPRPPGVNFGRRQLVVRDDGGARSGTRVARMECPNGRCTPTQMPRAFVQFTNAWPAFVAVWAGAQGTSLRARLRGYDGRGRVVAESAPVRVPVGGTATKLQLESTRHVVWVEIEQLADPDAASGTPSLTLDDLTWNDPKNPVPGFEGFISASSNGPGPLNEPARVRAGRAFEWTVKLDEVGGAYGRRRFTITGLPIPENPAERGPAFVTIDGQDPGAVTDDTEITVRATVYDDAITRPVNATEEETFRPVLVAEPVDARAGASTVATPLGELRVRPNVGIEGGSGALRFGDCGSNEDRTTLGYELPFKDEQGLRALLARRLTVTPRVIETQETKAAGLTFGLAPESKVLDADGGPRSFRFDLIARRTGVVKERIDVPVVVEVRDPEGRVLATDAALKTVTVQPDLAVKVEDVVPAAGKTPQLLKQGTEVRIKGVGLCEGARVMFGNEKALAPTRLEDPFTLVTTVPRAATTGPIFVLQRGEEHQWGAHVEHKHFEVDSFRNSQAYPFANFNLDDLEFKDTVNLYGYNATHYDSLDFVVNGACEFFTFTLGDCDAKLGAPDALALNHHFWTDLILSGDKPNNAHCFGMAVTSRQLLAGKVPLSKYGAKQVFDIAGPGGLEAGGIRRYLRAQHSSQLSAEFMHKTLGYFTNVNPTDTTPEVVQELKKHFAAGVAPVVAMSEGFGGHVVVAYDLVQDGDSWIVHTWDNNDPFTSADRTYNGNANAANLEKNQIVLFPNGRWSYPALKIGGVYDGSEARLMIFDGAKQKLKPTIPTDLDGFMTVVFGGTASATKAPGRRSTPFTTFDGQPVAGEVFTKGSKPLTRTIRPDRTRGGRYGSYVAGQGLSASLAVEGASVRDRDTFELDPAGGVELRSTAAKRSFGLIAARRAGAGSRGIRVAGTTARGATTRVAIDKAGVATIRAGGTTTLKLTLIGAGKGDGSVRKLPAMAVKRGAVVRIDPSSWADVRKPVVVRTKQPGRKVTTKRLRAVRR